MRNAERTVLFHVGAAPTASWLVQRCLLRNVELWRGQGMYCLPEETLTRDIGSGGKLIDDPVRFAEALDVAFADPQVDVVAGSRMLLGSAFGGAPGAGLHGGGEAAVWALAAATERHRRAVVLSVCPPDQLLEWHYEQSVTAGGCATFGQWLADADLNNVSWLPVYGMLCSVFGRDDVTVLELGRSVVGHIAFLRAFLGLAGLDLPDTVAEKTPPPAPRLSDKGVRLAIAANPHLVSAGERAQLRTFLQQHFSELDGPAGALLPPAQSLALRQRYQSEYALLAATSAVDVGDGGRR